MGEGIHTIGSGKWTSREEYITQGLNHYYNRVVAAKEHYDELARELDRDYPMYQRIADSEKGGAAKEEMKRRIKPVNDAYKAYQEAQKDFDRYREERARILSMPPSTRQRKKIVTSINDTNIKSKGRIVLYNEALASTTIDYNSKDDLARKIYRSIPLGFQKGLIGIKKDGNRYMPIFDKRTQRQWDKYISMPIDTRGD